MRWGRVLLAAIAVTVFEAIYGMLTCGWLFKWVYEIPPVEVWKPESTFTWAYLMMVNFGNFVLAFLMAAIFGWIYKGLPGKCLSCKGSAFGFIVFLLGLLPGMFSLYMFTTIAPTVLLYWGVSGLVSLQIIGLIISYIYGEPVKEA